MKMDELSSLLFPSVRVLTAVAVNKLTWRWTSCCITAGRSGAKSLPLRV